MSQDNPDSGVTDTPRGVSDACDDWAEALLAAEAPILRMIGAGQPIDEILEAIRQLVVGLSRASSSSIRIFSAPGEAEGSEGAIPLRSSTGEILGTLTFVPQAPISDRREATIRTRLALLAATAIERWRDDIAIRRDEQRFRQLAEAIPQIVWTAGSEGTVDYFNKRWYEYTGMTPPQSLEDDGWKAVIHPDDIDPLQTVRSSAVGLGEVFESEFRLRNREGAYRWHLVRSVPSLDETGHVSRRFGTAVDIDDRVRAEQALQESENYFRVMAASIPQLAWMASPDGSIFWFNKRWYEYVGSTFEEMKGWGWQSVHDPAELPRVLEKFKAAFESGSPWEDTFPLRRFDGEMRPHLSRAMPVKDEQGNIVRWFGTNTDITDRIRMEASLKEADRRKDVFLATLAHELRNPLAPIRNALYLMKAPDDEGRGYEAERAMAERQVNHLARLVDDLMDVSRINEGKIELRKEEVLVSSIVERAVETVRSSSIDRGHELVVEVPDEPIRLLADPTRLEQILWNLLNNAIKYTEPSGRISLSVGREAGAIVVRVRDSGIGIDPELRPQIFEMFVQAGHRPGRSQGGLGIGLSLVRNLVGMHGGTISVSSEGPGLGSEFVVSLPDTEGKAGRPPTSESPAGARVASTPVRRRVLVVDDNRDAADTLGRVLKRIYGQDVEVAYDGPSALDAADSFRPQLIFLDIGMPGMDGYEVARRLRERPLLDETLLVALTGWGQEQDKRQSKQAGFDRHLVKPVDPDAIRAILIEAR
jgi:PAS domain S-box-containing protein